MISLVPLLNDQFCTHWVTPSYELLQDALLLIIGKLVFPTCQGANALFQTNELVQAIQI